MAISVWTLDQNAVYIYQHRDTKCSHLTNCHVQRPLPLPSMYRLRTFLYLPLPHLIYHHKTQRPVLQPQASSLSCICTVSHPPSTPLSTTSKPLPSQNPSAPPKHGCVCKYKISASSIFACSTSVSNICAAIPHRRCSGSTNSRTTSTIRPRWRCRWGKRWSYGTYPIVPMICDEEEEGNVAARKVPEEI